MNIRGFRSEVELSTYLAAAAVPRGYVAPAQTMYDLSREWYRTRLEEDWEPPTAEEATAMFERHGLGGDFWRLA